jgi:pimeloyl-ACP methyl ester carboxylesterase
MLATSLIALLSAASADARVLPFPAACKVQDVATNTTSLHVRVCGSGPAVVLLHGYGETGDMWAPLAADLARDHTVIVPDLRGMGLSARPVGGYDKKTQGYDIVGVLDALKVGQVDLVTHDIGNMVGFAFVAEHRDRVKAFVLMDAPIPGVGPWDEILKSPMLWHFRFGGRIWSGWSPVASASISTASGTNFLPTPKVRRRVPPALRRDLRQARRDACRF